MKTGSGNEMKSERESVSGEKKNERILEGIYSPVCNSVTFIAIKAQMDAFFSPLFFSSLFFFFPGEGTGGSGGKRPLEDSLRSFR